MNDIELLLPSDVFDALYGAAAPGPANVFATMADLPVSSNIYNTDGALTALRTVDMSVFSADWQTDFDLANPTFLYFDAANNRLGINTPTPGYSLQVETGDVFLKSGVMGINESPDSTTRLRITSTGTKVIGARVDMSYTTQTGVLSGLMVRSTTTKSGGSSALLGVNVLLQGSSTVGVHSATAGSFRAVTTAGTGTVNNIGGFFEAGGGTTNYGIQVKDGSEGTVGHVLVSQTIDGKVNFADVNTLVANPDTIYTADGTLAGARTVTLGQNNLSIDTGGGVGRFTLESGAAVSQMIISNTALSNGFNLVPTKAGHTTFTHNFGTSVAAGIHSLSTTASSMEIASANGRLRLNNPNIANFTIYAGGNTTGFSFGINTSSQRHALYTSGGNAGGAHFNTTGLNTGNLIAYGNGGTYNIYSDALNSRVGIGTNAPATTLHVAGDLTLGNGTTSTIKLDNVTSGNVLTLIDSAGIKNSITFTLGAAGGLSNMRTTGVAWSMNKVLRFDTVGVASIYCNNGGSGLGLNGTNTVAGHIFIDSTGNVGIGNGIVAPGAKLHLNGSLRLSNLTTTPAAGFVLQSTDALGNADWLDPASLATTSLYSADGTLAGNRIVTGGNLNLSFHGVNGLRFGGADTGLGEGIGATVFNYQSNVAHSIQRQGTVLFSFGGSSPYNATLNIGTNVFTSSTEESVTLTQGRGITVPSLTTIKENALTVIVNRESVFLHNINLNRFRGYDGAAYQSFAYLNDITVGAVAQTYTLAGVAADRTFDPTATTTSEIGQVLGTLITDLKTSGIIL